MSRRLFLDSSPGEARGVVLLDGRPERLWIERPGEARGPRLGARYLGRIEELSPGLRLARLDLGGDGPATLPLAADFGLPRGAAVEIEISAEPRAGKPATARLIGAGSGPLRRIQDGPTLEERLRAAAPDAPIVEGAQAREAADEAEEAALAPACDLPGGLNVSIEPTRALVAVDIDWSGSERPSAWAALKANLEAIAHVARLMRLKALSGAVVIDLVGAPKDPRPVLAAAREAFAPDQPGVVILPVSRLGLLELARPHREQPIGERICGPVGRRSDLRARRAALGGQRRPPPRPRAGARGEGRPWRPPDRGLRAGNRPGARSSPARARPAILDSGNAWLGPAEDRYPQGMSKRPCPICRRPASETYAPFCSKRCADVDLQRWFVGLYVVPSEEGGEPPPIEDDEPE